MYSIYWCYDDEFDLLEVFVWTSVSDDRIIIKFIAKYLNENKYWKYLNITFIDSFEYNKTYATKKDFKQKETKYNIKEATICIDINKSKSLNTNYWISVKL